VNQPLAEITSARLKHQQPRRAFVAGVDEQHNRFRLKLPTKTFLNRVPIAAGPQDRL
jgi:hypothetical protein